MGVIERIQVARFNDVWQYCRSEVPFYRAWVSEHSLPEKIDATADLTDFPPLTKKTIVERSDEIFQRGKITASYSTGGTSGEPARYPRGEIDAISSYANTYVGRSWWGLQPFDSYVHLWGHSHLFAGGRWVQKAKRKASDALANATRLNAYDMTPEALEAHYRAVVRRNPTYIVGYTSAIFKLARHVETSGAGAARLTKLRAVIVTAETVSQSDVEVISAVFQVPVVIEYGAAETGVMAYSRGGSRPLQVFWNSFILQLKNDDDIAVTTLDERLFPLINYSIGDRAEPKDVVNGTALTLTAITGRNQDIVQVGTVSGTPLTLSAIMPIHVLKSVPGVTAVQFRQESPKLLRIYLSATRTLSLDHVSAKFAADLARDHPEYDPSTVVLEQVPQPLLTKAGKQALFVS